MAFYKSGTFSRTVAPLKRAGIFVDIHRVANVVSFRVALRNVWHGFRPCHTTRGSIRALRGCVRTSRETVNLWVSQKRTPAAEAVVGTASYGTAEAVPFVQRRFFIQIFGRCPRQQFVRNVPSQLKAVKHVCRALRSTVSSPRLHAPSKLVNSSCA
jgi:hypothetical protein